MNGDAAGSFVGKWLAAEPWHRLLLQFEPADRRVLRSIVECIGFELRSAALDSADPRVATGKLAWWREEWRRLAAGDPRHPLTIELVRRRPASFGVRDGEDWVGAAWRLAEDASDADLEARRQRWQAFARAQARVAAIDGGTADAAHAHALALLAERLPHWRRDLARGRLPLPLDLAARHSLDRARLADGEADGRAALSGYADALAAAIAAFAADAGASPIAGYRRGQLALARLRARQLRRRPADAWSAVPPLPRLRSAFAVWRAYRRP